MELFKITCVTCQAGLSVRNEALLGQIVACPRCGSMVEVAPPPTASAAVPAAVEPVTEPATAPQSAEPFETIDEATFAADDFAAEEASLPTASTEALQASAALAKYKLMVWSLASCFIGTAVIGVVLLTRNNTSAEATALAPSKIEKVDEALTANSTSDVNDLPARGDDLLDASAIIEAPPVAIPTEEAVENTIEVSENAEPVIESIEESETTTVAEQVSEEISPISQAPTPRVARRFDPLDFDPESLTLESVDQPTDSEVAVVESEALESPVVTAKVPEEVPSTAPLVRRGPSEGETASERDAAKQLGLFIPAVKVEDLPLVDCLRLFSQLSGVPISVAPEQLLMAGITPQHKVSLDAREISFGEMLSQVLQPLQLEYQTRGAQVVVVRQAANKIREINYPIEDLVAASCSEAEIASWVEQFIAPTTWQAAGGEGKLETVAGSLRVKQTQQVQYQVLIMLEWLRLANKLPPGSRFPAKRLAGTPANVLLSEKLARSATFTFSHYTRLDEIFIHWETELGVPLLVDWSALAELELWPATTIACAINDLPWQEALEKALEPLGLGWRAAVGGVIEVTAAEKVQSEQQLEIYSLRIGAKISSPELLRELRAFANPATKSPFAFNQQGRILLVFLPADGQRRVCQHLQRMGLLGYE